MKNFAELTKYLSKNQFTWLITGVSGFIGSNLIKKLSNSGHNLLCLARTKEKF